MVRMVSCSDKRCYRTGGRKTKSTKNRIKFKECIDKWHKTGADTKAYYESLSKEDGRRASIIFLRECMEGEEVIVK